VSGLVVDLFSGGPAGWCHAARNLGLNPIGIELDPTACATRATLGLPTVRADLARWPVRALRPGAVGGLIASPPCQSFSAAGKGAGKRVMDELASAIDDALAGRSTLAAHRRAMAAALAPTLPRKRAVRGRMVPVTRAERKAEAWRQVRNASLVVEPARWVAATRPAWVALEQVPDVLPLWRVMARGLGRLGYSTWAGILCAADYGVPQTRYRAILMASRTRRVAPPEPTHSDQRRGGSLFGLAPWVSMAAALGWDGAVETEQTQGNAAGRVPHLVATHRPAPAVVATSSGNGDLHDYERTADRPAPSVTSRADRWSLRTSYGTPKQHPKNGSHELDPAVRPSHAVTGKARSWTLERPATTVQGDPLVGRPGHKDRDHGEGQFDRQAVRITLAEALVLQRFPPNLPVQGGKTQAFQQVGNAIPPPLAQAILRELAG
jgi:DNA (cytosine-5)-methyltransferase 1